MIICPKCKSSHVAPIIYGMPSSEAIEAYERKELMLGDCCISDNDPNYGCFDCDYKWSVPDLELKEKEN